MPPAVDFSRQASPNGGNGARDEDLRIPLWVRVRIQQLGRHFVGKITLNVREGGIANFQVEPSGGDRLTFHPKH
jgi:hypothetical protein